MSPEIEAILNSSKKTPFPGIYENRPLVINKELPFLFVVVGPTGSGKTTLMKALEDRFIRVKTATTRAWRESEEPKDAYIWIDDKQKPDESVTEYADRIAEAYGLFETNIFAGNIYGTPKQNVLNALKGGRAILGTENNGVKSLMEVFASDANIVIMFVLPDSYKEIIKRVHGKRNDLDERIKTAEIEIQDSKSFVNYYIHNTELNIYSQDSGKSPLDFTKQNLISFVNNLMQV